MGLCGFSRCVMSATTLRPGNIDGRRYAGESQVRHELVCKMKCALAVCAYPDCSHPRRQVHARHRVVRSTCSTWTTCTRPPRRLPLPRLHGRSNLAQDRAHFRHGAQDELVYGGAAQGSRADFDSVHRASHPMNSTLHTATTCAGEDHRFVRSSRSPTSHAIT
jgi:hypothetical protein